MRTAFTGSDATSRPYARPDFVEHAGRNEAVDDALGNVQTYTQPAGNLEDRDLRVRVLHDFGHDRSDELRSSIDIPSFHVDLEGDNDGSAAIAHTGVSGSYRVYASTASVYGRRAIADRLRTRCRAGSNSSRPLSYPECWRSVRRAPHRDACSSCGRRALDGMGG